MNSFTFKQEINRLYSQVYSINESLSVNEKKEFMKGFNDGIKEGFGSFLGKMAHGVKQFAHDVKKTATGAYQKGQEIAGRVWNTVKDFANSVYTKIKQGITTAVEYLASAPGKIKEHMTAVYNQVINDMVSAYNTMKDKAQELQQAVAGIWDNIVANIQQGIATAKGKIQDAKAWFTTNKAIVETAAKEAQASSVSWLKQAGTDVLAVLQKIGTGALEFAKGVGYVAIFLIVGPIVGLVIGAKKLGQYSQQFVEAGINKVGEVWAKQKADFQIAYNAPIKENRHIKKFREF